MKRSASLREIRSSSKEELRARLARLESELFKLRLQRSTNQLKNVTQIRSTRREIARVFTILAEHEQKGAVPSQGGAE